MCSFLCQFIAVILEKLQMIQLYTCKSKRSKLCIYI